MNSEVPFIKAGGVNKAREINLSSIYRLKIEKRMHPYLLEVH